MKSTLDHCPVEVLDSVLELLSTQDLSAVSLVNSRLRSIAERFLYSSLEWAWTFGWPKHPPQPYPINTKTPPIIPFLQTISKRPELGAFVKNVDLSGDCLGRISHRFRGEPPTLPTVDVNSSRLISIVEGFQVEFEHLWIRELRWGRMDAFVALLLALSPNLKRLRLEENFLRSRDLVFRLLRTATCEPPQGPLDVPSTFQSLKEVQAQLSRDMRVRRTSHNEADFLLLFYMPSIQHIKVSIDNPGIFSWPAGHVPAPWAITSLDITVSREEYLGQLLSCTKNLKELRWDWLFCPDIETDSVTSVIDLDKILAVLDQVRGTLTDLAISATTILGWGDIELPEIQVSGSFQNLTGFTGLDFLELPLVFLTSAFAPEAMQPISESLPHNLKHLTISDGPCLDESWTYSHETPFKMIEAWLKGWKLSTPKLRQFCLKLRSSEDYEWGPLIADGRIGELTAKYGIDFQLRGKRGKRRPRMWCILSAISVTCKDDVNEQ